MADERAWVVERLRDDEPDVEGAAAQEVVVRVFHAPRRHQANDQDENQIAENDGPIEWMQINCHELEKVSPMANP